MAIFSKKKLLHRTPIMVVQQAMTKRK